MLTKFENKLIGINEMMVVLGNRIIDANKVILAGLESGDYSKFKEARESLSDVKKTADSIDNKIVATLALFAPEATDLKNMVAYLKVTNEYIRAASNTRSFLKNFPVKCDGELNLEKMMPNMILLQKGTIDSLTFAVSMISEDDKSIMKDLCVKANVEETKTDDIYSMIEKNLFVEMLNAKELSKEYFEVLSIIRKIEKIADRAAGIANILHDGHVTH
jgi:phosphate transport system protein